MSINWDLAIPAEAVQLLARPKVNLLLSAALGLWHDTAGTGAGGQNRGMKEGHAPLPLSKQPPPGPGLTAATTRPGEGARPHATSATEQHLGSVLQEQKAAAGWEGGHGVPTAKGQRCCELHH